ncbi:MAG: hypothetical protein ABSF90_24435 [Syntrophobacteraceae bacterium]|jgi:hypothetical protein
MGRKKKLEPDDPEQFARFAEVAENIKADDADEKFEEAFGKIIKAKPKKQIKGENH